MPTRNLRLRYYPDKFLRRICKPIKEVRPHHIKLASGMHELVKQEKGLGLAAPQVGYDICVVVINTLGEENGVRRTLYNPQIIGVTSDFISKEFNEGCLSFPGKFIKTTRSQSVSVKYLDSSNKEQIETFTGISAICVQHELDHLSGKLLIDHELDKYNLL